MKRWRPDLHSLSAQMIVSFVALVLLAALVAGLPAIWLIRDQLDAQAWAQVDQGRRAAESLYAAREKELGDLATLTAQRPTLSTLLAQQDPGALQAYLLTLAEGAGLDLLLLCGPDRQVLAQAGQPVPADLCAETAGSGFHVLGDGQLPRVWLYAARPLPGDESSPSGTLLAGLIADDQFVSQMHDQTGLHHTLLADGQLAATSLTARRQVSAAIAEVQPHGRFTLQGEPYYGTRLALDGSGLEAELALKVTGIALTQRRLIWALAGSILAAVAAASLLGIVLARRIGRPLARLAEATTAMSLGKLDHPLTVDAHLREVILVAHALESARSELQHTLADLLREKTWADHLLEAIVEGIVTLDRQGRITFFSQGAERITGWERDEVLGRSCDEVLKPAEGDKPFSELIPGPGRRHKILVETRDGRQAVLAATGARLLPPEAGEARVALVFRDVSEEEAVHRLLGHFLANVAHEFRTPLSALAASVELLIDQAPDLTGAELEELLATLHLGVLGLQTLIDNLLESASIEAGHFRVQPRPSDLRRIIGDAAITMQPLLDKRGQRLVTTLPSSLPPVKADLRRTAQVLSNLLSNASKYGPDDTEIEVRADVHGQWIRVAVADSGPGVPPQFRSDLFHRFRHTGPDTEQAPIGAGLGLSVVKAIVEAHGGEVGIEDHPGGGSVFWFTLPVAEAR